jgi:hypothetical protein
MKKNLRTKFVGMDVHQKSISIAIADDSPDGEVRLYGTITNTGRSHRQGNKKACIYQEQD